MKTSGEPTGFVVDGFERMIEGIEAEVRPAVEAKYADQWNSANLLKRWKLQKQMDCEIAEIVSERTKNVSDECLF